MPGRRAPEAARREQILEAAFKVACRKRLEGLTIRAIAAEAGLSTGLVLYHFRSRDGILIALLEWLIRRTFIMNPSPEVLALPTASARIMGLLKQEIDLFQERRQQIELFVDYWVLGIRNPRIRRRIRNAMNRYRDGIAPVARTIVEEEPERYKGIEVREISSLISILIEGWLVIQTIVDPKVFDADRIFTTISALVTGGEVSGFLKPKREPFRRGKLRITESG
jgi:TetR/AcrR family transcriptional regulator, transcriptional repressor of bet genes